MAYEIRQMAFAEILDTALQLLRDHFVLLVGTSAVVLVPTQLVLQLLPSMTLKTAAVAIVSAGLTFLIVVPFIRVLLTFLIGELYLGRPVSIGEAYRQALSIFPPLVGTFFLASLAIVGASLLLIIPGIIVSLWFVLINQVMVFERTFGAEALSRSRDLMRGNLLRAIGIFLLEGALSLVLQFGVDLALRVLPGAAWLRAVGSGLTESIAFSFGAAALVVMYFDIRCRKEGFDLEHLARLVETRTQMTAVPTA
jgi:hypothetical protein